MNFNKLFFCILGFFGLYGSLLAFDMQTMQDYQIPEQCMQIAPEVCIAFDQIQTCVYAGYGVMAMKTSCNLVDQIAPQARARMFKMALRQPMILTVYKDDQFKRRVHVFFEQYADVIKRHFTELFMLNLSEQNFDYELQIIKAFTRYMIDSLNFEYVGALTMEDTKCQQHIVNMLDQVLLWINGLIDTNTDVSLASEYCKIQNMLLDMQCYGKKSFNIV